MNEIYWITCVGGLDTMFTVLWTLPVCLITVYAICFFPFRDDWSEDFKSTLQMYVKRIIPIAMIGIIGDIFTPSKKEALLIYGLGTTIDYVKSNDKAKQLPDKAIEALIKYVETLEKERKDK